jgi:epoxyqueuosine reductase QueG
LEAEVPGTATATVRSALAGTGVDLVASCDITAYDARAPGPFRSAALMPDARGLIVAASAGPALWRAFLARMDRQPALWDLPNPYDSFVAQQLDRADRALASAGVRFLRFEAAFDAAVPVDFVALGELVGLGARGPFGMLIHPSHGAWWALRGAWLVDADVEGPLHAGSPCVGCPAPCMDGVPGEQGGLLRATVEARRRCVVGQSSRYDEAQIAYHHDREPTVTKLRRK